MKRLKSIIVIILILVVLGTTILVVINDRQAKILDNNYSQKMLNDSDKKSVIEAHKLRQELGDEIWPGFGENEIPIIIFNDKYEFVYGIKSINSSWKKVRNDDIKGKNYFFREAQNPQAFTTKVDELWAASMTSLDVLNREIYLNLRKDLPLPFNRFLPYQLVEFDNDYHITAIIHEGFHAFQADIASTKFDKTQEIYKYEKDYPYHEEKFVLAWNEEGTILKEALEVQDKQEKINLIKKFLKHREERRNKNELTKVLIDYEKNLEWLEGLAKYVEMEFYSLAAEKNHLTSANFKDEPTYWKEDYKRLDGRLGNKAGHNRFYISGMAQAKLLDQLKVDNWRTLIMRQDVYLEELLKKVIL